MVVQRRGILVADDFFAYKVFRFWESYEKLCRFVVPDSATYPFYVQLLTLAAKGELGAPCPGCFNCCN